MNERMNTSEQITRLLELSDKITPWRCLNDYESDELIALSRTLAPKLARVLVALKCLAETNHAITGAVLLAATEAEMKEEA